MGATQQICVHIKLKLDTLAIKRMSLTILPKTLSTSTPLQPQQKWLHHHKIRHECIKRK
jgi:hypothetical protein